MSHREEDVRWGGLSAVISHFLAGRTSARRDRWRSVRGVRSMAAILAILAGVLAVGSSGASAATGSSKPPIIVGMVTSTSGVFAANGSNALAGVKAGIASVNAAGGVLGRKLKLVYLNDNSNSQEAISAAKALLSRYKVNLFIPDVIFMEEQLPACKNVLTIDDTILSFNARQYPLAFLTPPSTKQQVEANLEYIQKSGYTEIGVLSTTDSGGLEFTQLAASLASQYKLKVVSEQSMLDTATDVTPELQILRSAGAQVLLTYDPALTGVLMSSMADLGWTAKVVGPILNVVNPDSVAPASTLGQLVNISFPINERTAAGKYSGYNGIEGFVKQIEAAHETITNMLGAAGIADDVKLAAWAWERAGQVNSVAAAKALVGMRNLKGSALPKLYEFPAGTNLDYTATVHDISNLKLPYSYWVKTLFPNTLINGTYRGTHL